MNDDGSVVLQQLLDRIRDGDEAARRELLERACARLRRLAATMTRGSFPAVGARHELDSIVHETWFRLLKALESAQPATVADFFRLAAHKIRQVLLDFADRQRRYASREILGLDGNSQSRQRIESGDQTFDPSPLALWTEFHEKVATLEDAEKAVFEMHYYLELPQVEIARLLCLHPRKVSYLWVSATEKLADLLVGTK